MGKFLFEYYWIAINITLIRARNKMRIPAMLPEIKTKRPNVVASGRFFSNNEWDASSAAGQDFVDQTIFGGLVARHEAVAVGVLVDLLHRLAGTLGEELVETFA